MGSRAIACIHPLLRKLFGRIVAEKLLYLVTKCLFISGKSEFHPDGLL
jgi:hypothetical protein